MKRFLIGSALIALLAGGMSSCKKTIEKDYQNPELITTGSMSKLLSGMFLNKRIHPSYYDFFTIVVPVTGGFSQITSLDPGINMYVPSDGYNQGRWDDYYSGSMPSAGNAPDYNYNGPGILSNYREMQTTYAALSPADQAKQLVYMQCAKVILYDQTAQMVDLWGDIPFSKAGSLNTSARVAINAPFDDQKALYDTCIAGLEALNTWFASANVDPDVQSEFTAQDILLGGKVDLWRRYTNSLLLRLLMRTSYYNETAAKTQVTAMLADPGTYPMIADNSQNVLLQESEPSLKSDLQGALAPLGNGSGLPTYAPAYLLDTIMVANNDPRTAVYWDSVAGQPYVGFPSNGSSNLYQNGHFATFDSATFIYNYNVPGVLFTAAEVSFLSAEAKERWGAGTLSAAAYYAQGISQSVNFWYGVNQSKFDKPGYSSTALATPSQTVIDNYVAGAGIAYTGTQAHKLQLIATQNWLNFFILQAGQAWAEYRRTGYPMLTFANSPNNGALTPPTRLLYPGNEKLYNPTNYAAVSGKDQSTTKIFWQTK